MEEATVLFHVGVDVFCNLAEVEVLDPVFSQSTGVFQRELADERVSRPGIVLFCF